jgi:hypothetical protein
MKFSIRSNACSEHAAFRLRRGRYQPRPDVGDALLTNFKNPPNGAKRASGGIG